MIHFIEDSVIGQMIPDLTAEQITKVNDSITLTIHEYCNTTFELVTYTDEIYDSSYEIVPAHRPIFSVSSLTDDSVALVENTSFYVYEDKVVIPSPSGTRKGLKISYKAGFEAVPEMVKTAALDLLKFRIFKDTEGNLLFYKSQVVEEREYEVDENLTESKILSQLSRYYQPLVVNKSRKKLRVGYIL